jgi:alpha-glucosidase
MARRSGDTWYLGAMTGWDALGMEISLDFLPEGEYTVEMYVDGPNSYRIARDYKKVTLPLSSDRKLTINMAPGGGFAAVIKPVK